MRKILIWKNEALPPSETFIRNQMDAMRTWRPKLAGLHRVQSPLNREEDDIALKNSSALSVRVTRFLGRSKRIDRLLSRNDVDLIHAHFAPSAWTILSAARSRGVPLVVTLHGVDVTALPQKPGVAGAIYRWKLRQVLRRCDRAIAVSDFIRKRALEYVEDDQKIVTHHIGIKIPVRNEKPSEPEWDLLFVGRFVDKKGIDDLIRALEILQGRGLDLKVGLVGDGPDREPLEAQARAAGLPVSFLGTKVAIEVRSLMASARIGLVPSRVGEDGDCEGLPTVAMEFAAAGVPIVGTVHSGIPEVVIDGVTGLLASERDPTGLADRIEQLMRDPSMQSEMGMAGRDHIVKNFDIHQQTVALEELYDEILSDRANAGPAV